MTTGIGPDVGGGADPGDPGFEGGLTARLARNAAFGVGRQVWLVALGLVATPVIYHGLGEDQYGLLAVVNLLVAQLYVLEFGFGHATVKYVAAAVAEGSWDEAGRVFGTSLSVFLVSAVVGGVALFLLSGTLVRSYFQVPAGLLVLGEEVIRIGALFFAMSLLTSLFGAVWRGLQRFGLLNLLEGGAATVQTVGTVALVLLGLDVVAVVLWSVALGAVMLGVNVLLLRRTHPALALRLTPDGPSFRRMAWFGVLLMIAGILYQVFTSGGPIVLGHYVLVGVLPFYTIPYGAYQKGVKLIGSIGAALFPMVAELEASGRDEEMARIFEEGTRVLALAALPLAAAGVLLADPFLTLWMGAEFAASAAPVLQVFALSFAFALAAVPSTELARGGGAPHRLAWYTGALAAGTLGGTFLLAPGYGVVGAAAAFAGSQAVAALGLVAVTAPRGVAGLGLARIVLAALGVGLASWLILGWTGGALSRLGGTAVLTGSYLWVARRALFREEEWERLARGVRGLAGRRAGDGGPA